MGLSNAERQRRFIARLKAAAKDGGGDVARLQAENAALKAEIEKLKAHGDGSAALKAELAAAKARIDEMRRERLAFRFGGGSKRQEAKPKAKKPLLPPDEERDRRIKALTTANKNLRMELRYTMEWHKQQMEAAGGMSFQTMSKIAKPLASDHRKHLTREELDAELDEACKLFTAWKADKDKARRRR